ncbi:DUF3343 domain-containing protein [Moorella sulfitireducens (nom. illeg.)]|uniref:DUF3343 domain-containing protein n=1 Tax=Neomoorella sulfitireducens TaxID=2972948 RepID=UPI0021AD4494|nr:DUF3343 domain-containing protein [Moorella sulfitireducens]
MPDLVVLLTFPSTYYALKAEKIVQGAGLQGRLIPMPREVSSLCGLALELEPGISGRALDLLLAAGVKPDKEVKVLKDRGRLLVIEVITGNKTGK